MNRTLLFFLTLSFTCESTHAQWTLSNTGLSNPGVFSFAISGANIFVGDNVGVCLSTNNAAIWTPVLGSIGPVMALATDGTNTFAGSGASGVFLSVNNGSSWTPVDSGLTNQNVSSLVMDGSNIFAGTTSGGVFLSTNNGSFWTAVNTGLTNLDVRALAVNGSNIFGGTNGGGIFLSNNNGATWTPINTGLPAGVWVRSIIVSGTNIFAAMDSGIYRSVNNGSNWSASNLGLTSHNVFSLVKSGSNIFAGTEANGIFLSTDNGNSWIAVNDGFPSFGIAFGLAVNATNIFAAMYSEGIYTRALNEITGIREVSNENVISVSPNPCNGKLTIQINSTQQVEFALYNSIAEKIIDKTLTSKTSTIDLSAYSNGIYFYKLSCDGHVMKDGKIIKQ